MLLQELLNIDEEVYLIEESYLSQRTIKPTLQYLKEIQKASAQQSARFIRVREGENTLAILFYNQADENVPVDFWAVFTGAFATVSMKKEFEGLANSLFPTNFPERDVELSAETWFDAVTEYYSLMLVSRNLCPGCSVKPESYKSVFSENRVERVKAIFEFLKNNGGYPEDKILEVCCGNGMSTLALYRLGLDPLAIEINKCTVCQGLEQGVLNPKKTLVMDATTLSRYFEPGSFNAVIGFMLGMIYEFNKELWITIMKEAVKVASKNALLLFTVSSKPEIEILAAVLAREGIKGDIIDNADSEGTYDQWFFVGRK